MAKKKNNLQNTSKTEGRSFQKGMNKDLNKGLIAEGAYLSARNAVNNSRSGDVGVIGNEPSNLYCTSAPYTIIGAIHRTGDTWVIFSTDDTNSEIGLFDESKCEYKTIANDPCLAFKQTNLIIGETKESFDCTWHAYWSDNLNPDRVINLDNPAWIQDCTTDVEGCTTCEDTTDLDCERLRMARLTIQPCVKINQGLSGGEIYNGTYQVCIAYTENEQRISDYSIPSNIVSLFDHRNVNGSLDVTIVDIDQTYDEFELVVMSFVNQQLVARKVGIYSTHQTNIGIDQINNAWPAVPIRLIPLDRPSYEKSEGIYRNGDYLIRVAPTTRFSFNYQILANTIKTKWVAVEYPPKYYRDAGVNIGYMRDEVYSFFIRWIYTTNDKTESYHIPGREGVYPYDTDPVGSAAYGTASRFEATNNATILPGFSGTTSDGGVIVDGGDMGYWESSELYPDRTPEVWGDLCGKNIRHHKMPSNETSPHFNNGNKKIRVLGVRFSEIPYPVDNNNVPIPGIAGYEILRGSREGHKTVVAKGMLNNMGKYIREDNGEAAYYQNYPYNDLRSDPFLSTGWLDGDDNNNSGNSYGGNWTSRENFTFHSPDTQFKHPFLSQKELKIYGTLSGITDGKFVEPYKHPFHVVITDKAFIISALVGFGIAIKASQGVRKTRVTSPHIKSWPKASDWLTTAAGGGTTGVVGANSVSDSAKQLVRTLAMTSPVGFIAARTAYVALQNLETGGEPFVGLVGDINPTAAAQLVAQIAIQNVSGIQSATTTEWDTTGANGLPKWLQIAQGIPAFIAFWGKGTDAFLRIIKAFSRPRQYVLAYQSHCFFNNMSHPNPNFLTGIKDSSYISNRLQEFGGITINNLYRGSCVGLTLSGPPNAFVPDPVGDNSRVTMGDVFGGSGIASENVGIEFSSNYGGTNLTGVAHYVGLKQRFINQYGQVDGILQVPTSSCMQEWVIDPQNPAGATSEVIFGGDIYIGRYTEKNTFFYFFDWMYDVPEDFEYDYRLRKMMPFPTYWMDTRRFQLSDFFQGIKDMFTTIGGGSSGVMPSGFHNFERYGNDGQSTGLLAVNAAFNHTLVVKNAFMYLFNSGVRDFYVESEVNVEYRDWNDKEEHRHYDPYLHTSLENMFRTDIIKAGNLFRYDYSLSASRYYQLFTSWGFMQYRNYDPIVAETCYSHYPKRIIYSLEQNKSHRYDNWLINLINNKKDFISKVTSIKPIGKSGAMMLFETDSPALIPGVDVLKTDIGTKITIGDGGLFNLPIQNMVNADSSYEYASCINRLSVINTPAGLFWISQDQGKIFNYGEGLSDITQSGMKWWFDEFLPYKILEDFPDFNLLDNTVVGVGCQSVYDNADSIVYFTKRDFKLKPEFVDVLSHVEDDRFETERKGDIRLGDPRYFDNASWTVSYDPKAKAWISFHDWHPNFLLPSKNNFLSIANAGIWLHNTRADSYCNYYGQDHPFEIELVTPTGQNVNTLKSIEYLMETFVWDEAGIDRNHVLDFSFDRAVVYNTEQMSGELRLNLTPKNNAPEILTYPRVNPSSIDILYSKEEQKFRFNQFWDITDNRGEFSNARRMMWLTNPNGYTKEINPLYVDYSKSPLERKKFRHYQSNLLLRRRISGPHNMQLKLVSSKNQYSMR